MSGPARRLKGLVLAGRTGSPPLPFGQAAPTGLLPVANRPLISYAVEDLVHAGIREIGVVVGEGGLRVRAALGDGSRFGAALTFIHQEKALGSAHALRCAEHFLAADRFVVYQGDTLLPGGIGGLVADFLACEAAAHLLLAPVERPACCAVAERTGEEVVRLAVQPEESPGNSAGVGVYGADHRLLEAARQIIPSPWGQLAITDAVQWLRDQGRPVGRCRLIGCWVQVGSPKDLLLANRLVLQMVHLSTTGQIDAQSGLDGAVMIAAGARIVRSVLRGPLVIGARTLVQDSLVGPYTPIGESCTLEGATIANSIVMAHSRIGPTGRPIEVSVVGRYARIGREERVSLAYRLALGDHATLAVP